MSAESTRPKKPITHTIKINGADLSSRQSAIDVRNGVEAAMDSADIIVIDLSGVKTLASSYGDELFGILVEKHGIDEFLGRIRIAKASPEVMMQAVSCIKERTSRDELVSIIDKKRDDNQESEAMRAG